MRKLTSILFVLLFAFTLMGCASVQDSGDAMMEDSSNGDAMMEDGDAMMEEGDAMEEDGEAMEGDAMMEEGDTAQ